MELYLDSANLAEINQAFELGFLTGLTTTPTFMHREGIKDLDSTILDLSKKVPILQIEALGSEHKSIIAEAQRLLDLGLSKEKTVFKIPVSIEGVKACQQMIKQGMQVNIHLVYTLQQAYMAMAAGASYVCPLAGRLQDQGHDALGLFADCVDAVERYNYPSKIMFSSVRHVEHVRNALQIGVHACTVPWKVMTSLTSNHFTALGTKEFIEHTNLLTINVRKVVAKKPQVMVNQKILTGLMEMTKSKLGAVAIVDQQNRAIGIFTDGDLRRGIETQGQEFLEKSFNDLQLGTPITVDADISLDEAWKVFNKLKVDTLIVNDGEQYLGMIDIQELLDVVSNTST